MRIDVLCVVNASARFRVGAPIRKPCLSNPHLIGVPTTFWSLNRLCFLCVSGVAIAFFVIGTMVVLKTSLVPTLCSETNTASQFHFLQRCPALSVSSFVHYYKLIWKANYLSRWVCTELSGSLKLFPANMYLSIIGFRQNYWELHRRLLSTLSIQHFSNGSTWTSISLHLWYQKLWQVSLNEEK